MGVVAAPALALNYIMMLTHPSGLGHCFAVTVCGFIFLAIHGPPSHVLLLPVLCG